MTEPFDQTITIICPASLLVEGNHLANCFESCMPASPVLSVNCTDGVTEFAAVTVPCRASWLQEVISLLEYGVPIPEPAWNAPAGGEDDEERMLVDMAAVAAARAALVVYTPDASIPADKITIAANHQPPLITIHQA